MHRHAKSEGAIVAKVLVQEASKRAREREEPSSASVLALQRLRRSFPRAFLSLQSMLLLLPATPASDARCCTSISGRRAREAEAGMRCASLQFTSRRRRESSSRSPAPLVSLADSLCTRLASSFMFLCASRLASTQSPHLTVSLPFDNL